MARLLFKDENGTLHTVYGVRGIRGDGIADVDLNERYELVFTTDDGIVFTTDSIRGPQGAPGRDGLPDGSSGLVLLNLNDDINAEYPVAFRSSAFEIGVEEVTETLDFDEFTYNPSTKTLTVDKAVAQVSDSISAVTSVTEGNLESGDTLRDLFGKIRRKFGEIKDFVKTDLATSSSIDDAARAVASSVTAALQNSITSLQTSVTNLGTGKADAVHYHNASTDITSGILPEDVFLHCRNKMDEFRQFCQRYGLEPEDVMYFGDDVPDIELLRTAGCGVCPSDAVEEAKAAADLVSTRPGGRGCLREVIENTLRAQGKWTFDTVEYKRRF